jgi:hypothetical protein
LREQIGNDLPARLRALVDMGLGTRSAFSNFVGERFMKRALLSIVAAAVICLGMAPGAYAQDKPGEAAGFVGRLNGVKDFNGHQDTPYDGTAWWELRADGTFIDNANETGAWSAQGSHFTLQYNAGGVTVFTGTLIDGVVVGTMHNSDSSYTGAFAIWRSE